ncbi:hypothetical protein RZS08_13055, partial [Arthrospira platensis SPKY1]|nr:hypothetical protein [Arthrospira platensis SPKY1]
YPNDWKCAIRLHSKKNNGYHLNLHDLAQSWVGIRRHVGKLTKRFAMKIFLMIHFIITQPFSLIIIYKISHMCLVNFWFMVCPGFSLNPDFYFKMIYKMSFYTYLIFTQKYND